MPYDICDDEVTLDFIESEMAKRGKMCFSHFLFMKQLKLMPNVIQLGNVQAVKCYRL